MTNNTNNSGINWRAIGIQVVITALIFGAYVSFETCKRQDKSLHSDITRTKLGQKLDRNKAQILNADSLNSATEAKIRLAIDSAVKATKTRQIKEKIVYRYIKVQDEQLERDYIEGKATSDSVISSKNNRIKTGETLLARSDSLRGLDSLKIGSFKREIEGKNVAIKQLSSNIDLAVEELESNDKKIRKKNTLLKISGGIIALLGVLAIAE